MTELTSIYADFIRNTGYEKLSPETVSQAKKCLLDFTGVSIAGYKLMEFPQWVVDYMTSIGGIPEATVIGRRGRKFPGINAALANGACAHALDMDDGHRYAGSHPGATVIPAAIAAAEMTGADARKLLAGIVCGYEICIRISIAVNPSSVMRGFHLTGTVGPFGAAAAAASIMGLDREQTTGALGLAGLQGAGFTEIMHDNEAAKVKSLHPGKAASAGLFSAILAKRGARGPRAILEGEDGFLRATADAVNKEALTRGLGDVFEINNTYTKFYPACRHTHVAIDATLAMTRREKIDPDAISEITVETYPVAIKLAPTVHPATPSAARFSLPFTVAAAVIQGEVTENSFSPENVRNEKIQALAGKVKLIVTDKWEKPYPAKRGVGIIIAEKNGKVHKNEMDLAIGEPENPATWDDFARKFYANATLVLPRDKAAKLEETVLNLEKTAVADFARQLEL